MTDALQAVPVLIVEDGDEYLDNLARLVPGPRYLQAHDGAEALLLLAREPVQLVYLDMRFDRIDPARLLGDRAQALRNANGDQRRAERQLALNQGLYVLDAIRRAGYRDVPALLAYDFSSELARFARLSATQGPVQWVPDAVHADVIRERMLELTRGGS